MSHHGLAPIEQSTLGTLGKVPGLLPVSLLQRGCSGWRAQKKLLHGTSGVCVCLSWDCDQLSPQWVLVLVWLLLLLLNTMIKSNFEKKGSIWLMGYGTW